MQSKNEKQFWAITNIVIFAYAILPVFWILSLSLKPSGDLNDQHFFPRSITFEHYSAILSDPQFPAALWNCTTWL